MALGTVQGHSCSSKAWTEIMHRYIDGVDEVVERCLQKCKDNLKTRCLELEDEEEVKKELKAAWWVMVLRGFLWDMTTKHQETTGLPYSSEYWGDSTLVLIA